MRKVFGLAFLGFLVWMALLLIVWGVLRWLYFTTSFWTLVGALSTALTGASIAVGGFVAYRELSNAEHSRREAEKSRHIDIADRLFDELNSEENTSARRWVYQILAGDPATKLVTMTQEDKEMVKRVLNSLDRVSFLTREGWIEDDIIMPWMHPMIAKSWEKLEPFVKYERARRNEPYYYAHAENLANRCHIWRVKNGIDTKTTPVDNAI